MAEVSQKERKKEENNVINNVIITFNKFTVRLIRTFSVAPDKLSIYSKFSEIAKREAGSRGFSEVLLKAMKEYNQRHEEGNPQLKIASYLPNAEKSPLRVLCWASLAGATNDGKVYCRKHGGAWIPGIRCYSCPDNELRKQKGVSS